MLLLSLCAFFIGLLVAAAVLLPLLRGSSLREKYQRIERDMSRAQVHCILGEPDNQKARDDTETWVAGDYVVYIVFRDGRVSAVLGREQSPPDVLRLIKAIFKP